MFLSKAEHQQARASLASGRSWERFKNQTIGGASCSAKLGVNLDGSWWLSVPTGNFEDNVVKGETLADFDRQVGWSCPDCNAGVGGDTPCPVCGARARRIFMEKVSFYHDFSAGEYSQQEAEKEILSCLSEVGQDVQKVEIDVSSDGDITIYFRAEATLSDGQTTIWDSGYLALSPAEKNRACFVCGEVFNHKDFPNNEHLCGVCGPYKSRLGVREHQGICRCGEKVTAYVRDKKSLGNDGESVPYHYSQKCHPFRRDGKRLIVNK